MVGVIMSYCMLLELFLTVTSFSIYIKSSYNRFCIPAVEDARCQFLLAHSLLAEDVDFFICEF